MPDLKIKTGDRSFQMEWYSKKDWLCGSVVRNGLFCWPCLLFKPGASQSWTERGYTNLWNVLPDGKKHEKSKSHLEAYKMECGSARDLPNRCSTKRLQYRQCCHAISAISPTAHCSFPPFSPTMLTTFPLHFTEIFEFPP